MNFSVFFRLLVLIYTFLVFGIQAWWDQSSASKQEFLAQKLKNMLQKLGPVYTKLGQILSMRPDFLPEVYCQELEHCLENSARVPYAVMNPYKDHLLAPVRMFFQSISDTPIASASISEVFTGKLLDGRKVAIKILKPDIYRTIRRDIAVLYVLCSLFGSFIGKVGKKHWKELIHELESWMKRETNLQEELSNMEILRKELHGKSIHIPETFPHLCSREVLVMQYIPGKTLLTLMKEYRKGKTPKHFSLQEKLIYIVETLGLESLERNYLHADLHPANIILNSKGEISLLDSGLVEYFDFKTRQGLTLFLMGAVSGSADLLLYSAKKIATIPKDFDEGRAFKILDRFCKQYAEAKIQEISTGQFMMRILSLCMKENIHFDWSIILYTKSALGLDGVGIQVHPDFYFGHFARNKILQIYAKNVIQDASSLPHIVSRFDTAFESWKKMFV